VTKLCVFVRRFSKVGNSGVSIANLDDMKVLYGGFDLMQPARRSA
jgi:methylmalonyl-CoA mutase N-terminal domain/subunit